MEIRRFGVGHRHPEGPPGSRGVESQTIHVDPRGMVAELALRPHAVIAPHSNPNLSYLVVIEGGGFVQVGEERSRVAAGEAVVWPPNVIHAAWTDLTPMRAIVVEFAAEAGDADPLLLEAPDWRNRAEDAEPNPDHGSVLPVAEGSPEHESPEGEPR